MMSECRDPAIKLFGKTIALPSLCDEGGGDDHKGSPNNKEITVNVTKDKEQQECPHSEEKSDPVTSSLDEIQKPNSFCDDRETASEEDRKSEEQQSDSAGDNPQEKPTLKKPDKILPCPRCNSMDTKFCYYNNYNVNQPRHFCKKCQRYWTAGGTMRNVPVGAGRRKNKNSAANHYRHLTDAASLQAIPDSLHHHALKPNGTVLSFGSDTPLCESMASVLNLAEKTMKNCNRNGFHHQVEEQMEEQSSGSSATASNSTDEGIGAANLQKPAIRNCQGFAPHPPYINGSPWPYPWSPPPPPPPGAAPFCGSSFPIPIYAATTYWGCSTWSIPWLAQPIASPPLANGSSGPNSLTLGKHSRDGDVLQRNTNSSLDRGQTVKQSINQEKCLWVPKTLRIDDPEEAAKSSIWATMGFNSDKSGGISSRGGLFKSFHKKAELNNHKAETSQLLHANPAALSRSVSFQESS